MLGAYREGRESLRYDFMITGDGGRSHYWMRITARIFYWEDDQSARMLVYRQNIDGEKRQELLMAERMQRDSLSGLYNKAATQELARRLFCSNPGRPYALFILDIDNFKSINDSCGHAVGDRVIAGFAAKIRQRFRDEDIVGASAATNSWPLCRSLLWSGRKRRRPPCPRRWSTNFPGDEGLPRFRQHRRGRLAGGGGQILKHSTKTPTGRCIRQKKTAKTATPFFTRA